MDNGTTSGFVTEVETELVGKDVVEVMIRTAPESGDPVLALTGDEAQAFLDRL